MASSTRGREATITSDAVASGEPQPKDHVLHFPLQDEERVLMICHRHWLFLWPRIAVMGIVALVPVIGIGIGLAVADSYGGRTAQIYWIASLFYLGYWAVRMFLNWYRYNNDIWVITNQRIIDSTKTNPFSLKMSTADLVNIQDMTVERSGVLRTLFNFGDVICQTAADVQEFSIRGVPRPQEVQLLVDRERDRERGKTR